MNWWWKPHLAINIYVLLLEMCIWVLWLHIIFNPTSSYGFKCSNLYVNYRFLPPGSSVWLPRFARSFKPTPATYWTGHTCNSFCVVCRHQWLDHMITGIPIFATLPGHPFCLFIMSEKCSLKKWSGTRTTLSNRSSYPWLILILLSFTRCR
jgi:hypothetical protein